jgi:hypothetical protein
VPTWTSGFGPLLAVVIARVANDGVNVLGAPLQKPATVIANIESVAGRFEAEGLVVKDYLRAAIKQPSLFTQAPETIIGHVNFIIDLHRQGPLRFSDEEERQPAPLFDWLVKNPQYFSLADDNFTLREVAARITSRSGAATATVLYKPRHRVESDLAKALGHPDLRAPVPKEPVPTDGAPGCHARNVLLRGLIRAGIVKGGKLER